MLQISHCRHNAQIFPNNQHTRIIYFMDDSRFYTLLQNKRRRRIACPPVPPPPPSPSPLQFIWERLNWHRQIIHCWKGNSSEINILFRYFEKFSILQIYGWLLQNGRPFSVVRKRFKLLEYERLTLYHFKAPDLETSNNYITCFARYLNFAKTIKAFIKLRNVDISRK